MADTRQFTDHNEIGGVNVYLEDKKLAESPEKNTVESTDYVLLKNTEGVPQKISKANLMSVVKDAIGELLKSNDLGTSVTNVPALNASAFGSATLTNLASVLGVELGEANYSSDLNYVLSNPKKIQTTAFSSTTANRPPVTGSSSAQSGVAIYIPAFISYYKMGIQIASKYSGDEIFIRVLWTESFTAWKQISLT